MYAIYAISVGVVFGVNGAAYMAVPWSVWDMSHVQCSFGHRSATTRGQGVGTSLVSKFQGLIRFPLEVFGENNKQIPGVTWSWVVFSPIQ